MSDAEIVRLDEVDIILEPHDWAWARANAERIAAHWRDFAARRSGVFDGTVLLMHRWERRGGRLAGACFETRFSAFNAWRRFGFPDLTVRNFFGMAALRAQDGAFLLGEMASQTANGGESYFPAGTPDPGDLSAGSVDLAGSVLRELHEETGLGETDVEVRPGWTLAALGGQMALMREVRIAGDGEAAAARIRATLAAQGEPELARIHVLRRAEEGDRLTMPPFMQPYLRFAFAQAG